MMQEFKEDPLVRLNRLAQDHSRRSKGIVNLSKEIAVLEEQLKKKNIERQEVINIKASIETKMKVVAQELT
jgi:hypothetical protein